MNEPDFMRQLDIFSPAQFKKSVHVIGVGAIGSWVTLILAKMGVRDITIYDFDRVEAHNPPNQVPGPADDGRLKVEALAEHVWTLTGIQVNPQVAKVDGSVKLSGVVFLGVDTMAARKEIWQGAIRYNLNVDLMLETRMAAEGGIIYTIKPTNPLDVREWEKTLFSDEEAEQRICTAAAISTTVAVISGMAVHNIVKFAAGNQYDKEMIVNLNPPYIKRRNW